MIERMNRGRIVISSINRDISLALRRMLGGTALPVILVASVPAFAEPAPATATEEPKEESGGGGGLCGTTILPLGMVAVLLIRKRR